VVNDCIEHGIHGAFNRMIKALIESPSPNEEVVVSNFLRMSNFENNANKQLIAKVRKFVGSGTYLCEQVVGVHLANLVPKEKQHGSFDCDTSDELMVPSTQIYQAFK
jgi:hypothetical protein